MDTFSPNDFQQESSNTPPTGVEAKQLKENRETHDQQQPNNRFNSQYTLIGDGTYLPCGRTVKKLVPGVYEIGMTDNGVPFFISHPTRSDEWLTFRDSLISNVLKKLLNFGVPVRYLNNMGSCNGVDICYMVLQEQARQYLLNKSLIEL